MGEGISISQKTQKNIFIANEGVSQKNSPLKNEAKALNSLWDDNPDVKEIKDREGSVLFERDKNGNTIVHNITKQNNYNEPKDLKSNEVFRHGQIPGESDYIKTSLPLFKIDKEGRVKIDNRLGQLKDDRLNKLIKEGAEQDIENHLETIKNEDLYDKRYGYLTQPK